MKEFILNLYENDNFTMYLTIALVVLVVLFVIVLIFGKKDQKLEETKRLQKIELEKEENAFKEEQTEPVKIETSEPQKETNEITEIVETTKEVVAEEPKIEEQATESVNDTEEVNVTVFEPEVKVDEQAEEKQEDFVEETTEEQPVTTEVTDAEPISIDAISSFDFDEISADLEKGLNELQQIKNEFNNIEVPEIETKVAETEEKSFQPSQVFSSVFVNKEQDGEETKNDSLITIEPAVEETPEEEVKTETAEEKSEPLIVIQDDEEDDDFDLPTLKVDDEQKEEVITEEPKVEEPVTESVNTEDVEVKNGSDITAFSFDDLIGETYNIK